jgi:hypothetical protein
MHWLPFCCIGDALRELPTAPRNHNLPRHHVLDVCGPIIQGSAAVIEIAERFAATYRRFYLFSFKRRLPKAHSART